MKILIVDDSDLNREILYEILSEKYTIIEATNGKEAISILEGHSEEIRLVLLDIIMPEKSGFEVLSVMDQRGWLEDIPVIIISSETGSPAIRRAYNLGATDYISRPFDVEIVKKRISNTILLYAKQRRLEDLVEEEISQNERFTNMAVSILSHIIEFRNAESGMHITHIMVSTRMLLKHLRQIGAYTISKDEETFIVNASALHDIGKISIPDEILNKKGRLTDEEMAIMKTHTTVGGEIIRKLPIYGTEPFLKVVHDVCLYHHERYDGHGYPEGLVGDQIPLAAQIVSISDVYDALTSERCYKRAFDHDTAVRMILNGECGVFNPVLLKSFIDIAPQIYEEFQRLGQNP